MRNVLAMAATVAVLASTGVGTAAAADRSEHRNERASKGFVALGDSYASGAGIEPLQAGAPEDCSRSTLDFASLIARRAKNLTFTDATCAGARSVDLTGSQAPGIAPQLDAVDSSTRLVTFSSA